MARRRSSPPGPTLPAPRPAGTALAPPSPGTPWAAVVEAFLDAGAFAAHTRRAYRRQLQAAFEALGVARVDEITGVALARYKAALVARLDREDGDAEKLSPASVALAIAPLRRFLRWSRAFGAHALPDEVITEALRTPRATVRRPYRTLGDADMVALLQAAPTARDRAILAVMLGGGLRAAEIVALDVAHLHDADGAMLLHVHGKGRKQRLVPLQPDVRAILFDYLVATGRRLGDRGPLFLAQDRAAGARSRARLTTRALGHLVATVAKASGLTAAGVSPHALRHTFALRALKGGAQLVALAKILGHAQVTTTQRYVDHLELDDLRDAVPALPSATRPSSRSLPLRRENMLDTSPMLTVDLDTGRAQASAAAAAMLGTQPPAADVASLLVEEDRANFRAMVGHVLTDPDLRMTFPVRLAATGGAAPRAMRCHVRHGDPDRARRVVHVAFEEPATAEGAGDRTTLDFPVPRDMFEALQACAQRGGLTIEEATRRAIVDFLADLGEDEAKAHALRRRPS